MADREVRDARSIRTLSAMALVLIGALALAAVASLLWSSHAIRRATHDGSAAAQSQALVNQATVSLLTHRRLSNLWIATGEPALEEARTAEAAEVVWSLERAAGDAGGPHERALLELTARQAAAYLEERRRLEAETRDLGELSRGVRPYFDRAIASLTRLRDLYEQEVDEASAEISRAVTLSDVLGGALAALLLGALVATLLAVRRWIVNPTLALHAAIERFRRGELDARAPKGGARELRDVAQAYNAMADTIAQQRDGQLTYLAGVAHDLRNPLGAMKAGLALAACYAGTARGRHTLELLDRQTDRMARMVDDLLDATLIEAGRIEMKPEPVDLVPRARDCIELHGPVFPTHSITLEVPSDPVIVEADPVRVDQVLTNLLTNALKFSPAGSRIDVRVLQRGGDAVLEVQDRGIGMTRDEMRDLFAPFRRRAPQIAPGAGLGLSVVRRIVEAHGGRVEVESEPKAGSTFRVVLPIARRTESSTSARG